MKSIALMTNNFISLSYSDPKPSYNSSLDAFSSKITVSYSKKYLICAFGSEATKLN